MKKSIEEKEILTLKETAQLLSVTTTGIYKWVKLGILKPYKMGNRTYFLRSEIMEALLGSNRTIRA